MVPRSRLKFWCGMGWRGLGTIEPSSAGDE